MDLGRSFDGQRPQKKKRPIRPFLIQSDSSCLKRPVSTGLLFDWSFLLFLLIVSQVDFIDSVLFLEAVGVRE